MRKIEIQEEILNVNSLQFQEGADLRPPLNKELFPVHCPSGLKRADCNFFFPSLFQ